MQEPAWRPANTLSMATKAATSAGKKRAARGKRTQAKPAARRRAPAAKSPRSRTTRKPAKRRASKRAAPKAAPRRSRVSRLRWWLSLRGAIVVAIVAVGLAAGYLLWLRDSSLVAVNDVVVEGISGPDSEEIATALKREARQMTTLHVRSDRLEQAVSSFPTVAGLRTDVGFPHSLRIQVIERPPALVATTGDRQVPVAADGTLLPGVEVPEKLPRLVVDQIPAADRLEGEALDQALVLGAAPPELRDLIEGISYMDEVGVQLEMPGGLELRFGSGAGAEAKWTAAAAVLADPKLQSALYVDVRVPERPAVGGGGVSAPATPDPAAEIAAQEAVAEPLSTGG